MLELAGTGFKIIIIDRYKEAEKKPKWIKRWIIWAEVEPIKIIKRAL
jgi:hypothetical protein